MKILALEASTTSAKAMLYDTDTDTPLVRTAPYRRERWAKDPSLEAETVFQCVLEAGRMVLEEYAAGASSVPADVPHAFVDIIALVGIWHSIVFCDSDLKPLTGVLKWDDTSPSSYCAELRADAAFTDRYYHTSGCMVNAIYPFFKIGWLIRKGFDLAGCRLMNQGGYNNYRMTGERVTTRCNASGDGLLNIHKREYNWEMLDEFGVPHEAFSRLVDSEETFPLRKEIAERLGVRAGTPVLPSNADGGSNQVGAGALRAGSMTFSVGTSGALRIASDRPVIPQEPSTWCYLSPKGWLVGAATNGCCNCVDDAKGSLFPASVSYGDIEKMLAEAEGEDADRVFRTPQFLPFTYGERCPGWNDRKWGGWKDIRPEHDAVDRYIAVQQGVLFNLYQCYMLLTEGWDEPDRILLSGGILQSPFWSRMCADIFGKEMSVTGTEQESLLGGVVMAMESLGLIENAADRTPAVIRTIRPDAGRHAAYSEKFDEYLRLYARESEKLRS